MRTIRQNVASLTPDVTEDVRSGARTLGGRLEQYLGRRTLEFGKENSSDFEMQSASGKTLNNTQAVHENDLTHGKKMEVEPLLEAS